MRRACFPWAMWSRSSAACRLEVLRGLAGKGHTLRLAEDPLGGAQAIRIDHARGTLVGASDPRKDGCVAGY